MDADPEKGLADSGDLDNDLGDLITAVGEAAAEQKTAIVLFLDELQYVPENELAALIMALHNATSQNQLPVTMVAAGLPQLLGRMGRAKSYSERLFEFVSIGRLDAEAATAALCVPAEKEGATFDPDAIAEILRQTHCYPYFLQEWGKHSWNVAEQSPINLADAKLANQRAINELDASFFRVRFDRLTPSEKALHARDGRAGGRSASLRRGRRASPQESDRHRANTKHAHLKGHDLQPVARRHRLHGPAVRRLYEAHHA